MAHKKGQGSVKNGRDSESKRLGVKKADGQIVKAGNIIVTNAETDLLDRHFRRVEQGFGKIHPLSD